MKIQSSIKPNMVLFSDLAPGDIYRLLDDGDTDLYMKVANPPDTGRNNIGLEDGHIYMEEAANEEVFLVRGQFVEEV